MEPCGALLALFRWGLSSFLSVYVEVFLKYHYTRLELFDDAPKHERGQNLEQKKVVD